MHKDKESETMAIWVAIILIVIALIAGLIGSFIIINILILCSSNELNTIYVFKC